VVNDLAGVGSPEGSAVEAVVEAIKATGGEAVASHDSVATAEGGKAIVDCAVQNFGTVDAVIHNAGVWRHELFEDMTPDQLDPVLDVHLRGAFLVTRPAWSIMQQKGVWQDRADQLQFRRFRPDQGKQLRRGKGRHAGPWPRHVTGR
jgi:NAD(P)-dependent dehydrogenase (short-subunit alcohol dehydrogenase family)